MTINQYKQKFEELFNELCQEHGDCKYVSIEKSQKALVSVTKHRLMLK